jgi:hypothetical protein
MGNFSTILVKDYIADSRGDKEAHWRIWRRSKSHNSSWRVRWSKYVHHQILRRNKLAHFNAVMISSLLVANEKNLFSQAITMSGDVSLRRPRNMNWQNSQYEQNVHFLGLTHASSETRRKAFYEMKAEELIRKLPMAQHWIPTVDGEYIKDDITLAALADPENMMGKPDWCRRVIVGDTGDDVRTHLPLVHVRILTKVV